jgi:hypothetical protein
MGNLQNELRNAVQAFLAASPDEPQEPKPGCDVVSSPEELDLLRAFQQTVDRADELSEKAVAEVGRQIGVGQAYLLAGFAFRCALQGARTGSCRILRGGMLGLVLDRDQLDWRDVLVELSIIEDCSVRIGSDLRGSLEHVLRFATEKRRQTMVGYLNSPPQFRGLGVMGMVAVGSGSTLSYSQRLV